MEPKERVFLNIPIGGGAGTGITSNLGFLRLLQTQEFLDEILKRGPSEAYETIITSLSPAEILNQKQLPLHKRFDAIDIIEELRKEYTNISDGSILFQSNRDRYFVKDFRKKSSLVPEGFVLDFSVVRYKNNAKIRKTLSEAVQQKQGKIEKLAKGKNVSSDVAAAMTTDLQLALQDEYNWQQKLASWFNTYRAKNPIFAGLILILLAFWVEQALSAAVTTIKDTYIREEPSADSVQIMVVEGESELLIIGEAPYYYKVRFVDPETGEEYVGWISKRTTSSIE